MSALSAYRKHCREMVARHSKVPAEETPEERLAREAEVAQWQSLADEAGTLRSLSTRESLPPTTSASPDDVPLFGEVAP